MKGIDTMIMMIMITNVSYRERDGNLFSSFCLILGGRY